MNERGRMMVEGDGRPQGAPPRLYPTPVPTIYDCAPAKRANLRCIVGTGVVWMWGGAPCGRPSPNGASSYLSRTNTPCGRPSPNGASSYLSRTNTPCGRPSPNGASSYLSGIAPCGRPPLYIHTPQFQPIFLNAHQTKE